MSGLGLAYCQQQMEQWGGGINLTSREHAGTRITLRLPKADKPGWCPEQIHVMHNGYLVIADDDPATHSAWDHYLQRHGKGINFDRVYHFEQIDSLIQWLEDQTVSIQAPICYFIDHEFPGAERTGLDIIESYELQRQAYLVTSKFESDAMCQRLIDKHIDMVPKPLFPCMPLQVCPTRPDGVLVDDNINLGQLWYYQAKRLDKWLVYCATQTSFKALMPHFERSTPLYIDLALGESRHDGSFLAEEAYNYGFTNIYLVTGYERDGVDCPDCVKAVLGKEPPWEQYV